MLGTITFPGSSIKTHTEQLFPTIKRLNENNYIHAFADSIESRSELSS